MSDDKLVEGAEMQPLARIEAGEVRFSIGIRTLTFAFEHSEANNPYDDSIHDFKRQLSICDPMEFAKDICHEMNREEEDGSTPLTRFLDSMMEAAVDQGSLGIADPDPDVPQGGE